MPSTWFVKPTVARLDLGEGQWVEIKEQITYGEAQRLTGSMLRSRVSRNDGADEVGVDYARFSVLKLQTWLVDWSARDEEDKPVPLSPAAIENLDPATAEAIDAAINAHLARRAEGKATPASTRNGTS